MGRDALVALTRRADRRACLRRPPVAGRVDRIGELFSLFREGRTRTDEGARERERERGCKLLRHTTHSLTNPPTRSLGVGGAQTEAQSLREEGNVRMDGRTDGEKNDHSIHPYEDDGLTYDAARRPLALPAVAIRVAASASAEDHPVILSSQSAALSARTHS